MEIIQQLLFHPSMDWYYKNFHIRGCTYDHGCKIFWKISCIYDGYISVIYYNANSAHSRHTLRELERNMTLNEVFLNSEVVLD
jgi:hypothetical protein